MYKFMHIYNVNPNRKIKEIRDNIYKTFEYYNKSYNKLIDFFIKTI